MLLLHFCKERMNNQILRKKLLEMIEDDETVREELARTGELFNGYHPKVAEVHRQNAKQLDEIVAQHGWPDEDLVGKNGAEAAWRIVQHAIDQPDFQRRMLAQLLEAAAQGRIGRWQPAMLEDRIRALEGRPQKYGTQFDWDDDGQMSPYPQIEDPSIVNDLRASVGLPPIEETIARHREAIKHSGEPVPQDIKKRRAEMEAWARAVGWIKK
jgi:Family of unknown function (DUF6624)